MPPIHQREITKEVIRGAGITVAILAVSMIMPVFGLFGIMILPLPTLFYRMKLGRKAGSYIPIAAFIFLLLVGRELTVDLFIFSELLLLGYLIGELFDRNLSVDKTVAIASAVAAIAGLFVLLFYSHAVNKGLGDLFSDFVSSNLSVYQAIYDNMSESGSESAAMADSIAVISNIMTRVMPGLAISGILFIAWTSILLVKPILKKNDLTYPDAQPLDQWQAPEKLIWTVIGCGLLLIIPESSLRFWGINGLIVLSQIYFFQGIAIVSFYFKKKRMPPMIRWTFYTLMVLQIYVMLFVIGLGLFDLWLNVRRLNMNNNEEDLL
ncbi:MAG: YybS family protein [Deltaproteobacteria bacterium]|nr:YybS family protein [Deltaproteobacteria bacterium]